MQDKLIQLTKLYENVSKTTGKRYFVGNLSYSSKLLIFRNDDAREGEAGWTAFLAERQPKSEGANFDTPGGDSPMGQRTATRNN